MAYLGARRWMIVAGAYLLPAAALFYSGVANLFPPCLVSLLTGHSCPGCGMTRAALALFRLDLAGALQFNPLVMLVVPLLIALLLTDIFRFYRSRMPGDRRR